MKDLVDARTYFPGMGDAVADRTINRLIFTDAERGGLTDDTLVLNPDDPRRIPWENAATLSGVKVVWDDEVEFTSRDPETRRETWEEVALRVAQGNASLHDDAEGHEFAAMHHHLRQASLLMSGRHLQHGDLNQKDRPMEVFTNCLDRSTRILTMEYGPVEIGKIVGETVTVIAGDGVPRPARINAHGEQDLFEITFRSVKGGGGNFRKTVIATENHRWLLRDGSVTTELASGDVIRAITGLEKAGFSRDPEGVVHGLIFGDGAAHKRRRDHGRIGVSVGRTYASLRVCKADAVRDEIHAILDAAGYRYSQPDHADGDRVYYIGKFAHAKELPFTKDPEYIAGFIYGWWLADGSKGLNDGIMEISTSSQMAADWLEEHAGYAGLNSTMHRVMERKDDDGSFANGKPLHVVRLRSDVEWKVEEVRHYGTDTVYCPEEPVTGAFVLANGLLTGNCSTSAATFLSFYLLLNGSGVGRAYDDAMMKVDWTKMPKVVLVIDKDHPDRAKTTPEWDGTAMVDAPMIPVETLTVEEAQKLYGKGRKKGVTWHEVGDSRGGWAKALEIMERMAYEERTDEVLVLDFTPVRAEGSPIRGMQNRPSSGPGPLMKAIVKMTKLRGADMKPWLAAMFADHYAAECVLVGGARRAARMSTKSWRDPDIMDFIWIKSRFDLWSSNNSVTIDNEFRTRCVHVRDMLRARPGSGATQLMNEGVISKEDRHAWMVLMALAESAYKGGKGEPGIINQDKLTAVDDGIEEYLDGLFAGSKDYQLDDAMLPLMKELAAAVLSSRYTMITNPCGEITLLMLGGYCVIADVVPFHAQDDDDAEDAFRTAVRALMRTNLMDSLYNREVARTNRIGVGMTGFHEWAYGRFGFAWHDIIDEEKSKEMWLTVSRFKRAVVDEAERYAEALGVTVPHTNTTFKPAGTTSKLFGLTEGAHLPTMRWFLRWVQFRNDDPLVQTYREAGYPVRMLESYSGTTIVGFPTRPAICALDDGDWVVTAAEATPAEQYQFLRLLEKYWVRGVDEDGNPLPESGNQVSYTLKYDPEVVSFEDFLNTLIDGQFSIRCCSVMPQADVSGYEYQPEEPITHERFNELVAAIEGDHKEDVDFAHVDCSSGACPIDWEHK